MGFKGIFPIQVNRQNFSELATCRGQLLSAMPKFMLTIKFVKWFLLKQLLQDKYLTLRHDF